MLYLFKTHYSIGRGIIQVNEYDSSKTRNCLDLANLCVKHGISQCFVVDDSVAGILPIYNSLLSAGVSLVFGYRVSFVTDASDTSEDSNTSNHKNILFAKDKNDYESLIQLSSEANCEYFHKYPRIDYNIFHRKYSNLTLAVPFYDSFLHKNSMSNGQCIPDFRDADVSVFVEDNNLPFDAPLRRLAESYASGNRVEVVETQTVYYEKTSDVMAYQARRLMNRSGGKSGTFQKPELSHFSSDQFCILK